ncbi:MAG: putative transposase YbfD/YdcC [Gammaproteobacteria bacterium]
MVLGSERTEESSNEVTAVPALLALLALKGCIVTIDAGVENRLHL